MTTDATDRYLLNDLVALEIEATPESLASVGRPGIQGPRIQGFCAGVIHTTG